MITLVIQVKNEAPSGTYCSSGSYHSICYTFSENGHFEMRFQTCTDLMYGMGHFQIVKNKIILEFQKDTIHKDQSGFSLTTKPASGDSIHLKFIVHDLNDYPLPFELIQIGPKELDYTFSGFTDMDGNYSATLPKNYPYSNICVVPAFNKSLCVDIDMNQNSEFTFNLDENKTYLEDSTITMKYRHITDSVNAQTHSAGAL